MLSDMASCDWLDGDPKRCWAAVIGWVANRSLITDFCVGGKAWLADLGREVTEFMPGLSYKYGAQMLEGKPKKKKKPMLCKGGEALASQL